VLTGTAKNDNVSKTKQENLTPDATFIAALIATFIAIYVLHMLKGRDFCSTLPDASESAAAAW
jgi:hypothetical protein